MAEPLELDEAAARAQKPPELPRLPEPPPVWLVAVEDVVLPANAGLEVELNDFYVGLLEFRRAPGEEIVYEAENFRLRLALHETRIERASLRPLGVEVPSLRTVRERLNQREMEYEFHRGLNPGSELLLVIDPAGNYVQIFERRGVM